MSLDDVDFGPGTFAIEVSARGELVVHCNISDAPLVNMLAPSIERLGHTVRTLRAVMESRDFEDVMLDAAQRLESVVSAI